MRGQKKQKRCQVYYFPGREAAENCERIELLKQIESLTAVPQNGQEQPDLDSIAET